MLEVTGLSAVGHWAWGLSTVLPAQIMLSAGAVALLASVWAVFRADGGAVVRVSTPVRILLEVTVFAGATAALCATEHVRLATTFAVIAAVNEVLDHTL